MSSLDLAKRSDYEPGMPFDQFMKSRGHRSSATRIDILILCGSRRIGKCAERSHGVPNREVT